MKYVEIFPSDTLSSLTERVGINTVDQILADNGLKRAPNVGEQWAAKVLASTTSTPPVNSTQKITILNKYVENSDIYEMAALADEKDWKMLSSNNSFSTHLYVSDRIENEIPDSPGVVGNNISVPSSIYMIVNEEIAANRPVDSTIFANIEYNRGGGIQSSQYSTYRRNSDGVNPMTWFNLPSHIVLYSDVAGGGVMIPAYPEEVNDSRVANYSEMPELLYQYEPWQLFQSSGPRSNVYDFHLHRDMWTGDHTDGKANELIRFCQSQCYAKYQGSSVWSPTVSLYVNGNCLISGIMTQVDVNWTGPLGHDGWYLEFTLSLSITEVSKQPLNNATVASLPLIG